MLISVLRAFIPSASIMIGQVTVETTSLSISIVSEFTPIPHPIRTTSAFFAASRIFCMAETENVPNFDELLKLGRENPCPEKVADIKASIIPGDLASYSFSGAASFAGYAPNNATDRERKNYAGYVDLAGKPVGMLDVQDLLAARFL